MTPTIAALVALYLLPTLIGLVRGPRNYGSLVIVNVLLGWTFIGWVVALAMACATVDRPERAPRYEPPPMLRGPSLVDRIKEEMPQSAVGQAAAMIALTCGFLAAFYFMLGRP